MSAWDWIWIVTLIVAWTLYVVYATFTVTKAVLKSRETVAKEIGLAESGTLFNLERDKRLAAAEAVAKDRETWATPVEVFQGKPLVPEPKPLPKMPVPKLCPVCHHATCVYWVTSMSPGLKLDTAISLMQTHAQFEAERLEKRIPSLTTPPPPRPVPDDPGGNLIYGRRLPKKEYLKTKSKPESPKSKLKVTINGPKEKVTIEGTLDDEFMRTVRHELDNIA